MFDYKHTAGSLKWPLDPRDYSAIVLPASFILLINMYDCDILFHQLVANTQSYCHTHTHTLLCLPFCHIWSYIDSHQPVPLFMCMHFLYVFPFSSIPEVISWFFFSFECFRWWSSLSLLSSYHLNVVPTPKVGMYFYKMIEKKKNKINQIVQSDICSCHIFNTVLQRSRGNPL